MTDPLAAETDVGPCRRCDNHGSIPVTREYAERVGGGDLLRVRAALNSVYPCPRCRPELFQRWAEGHFEPDHDPGDCETCKLVRAEQASGHRPRRRRRSSKQVPNEPTIDYDGPPPDERERRDLA